MLVFERDSIRLQKILGFDDSVLFVPVNSKVEKENFDMLAEQYETEYNYKGQMNKIVAPRPLNPFLGNQSLFVYSDVADFSYVGDSCAQMLRIVPIKGTFMDIVTERFDIPHYVPVLRNHFESIQVGISTDLGDPAKFATGKSFIKLHFRPARPF